MKKKLISLGIILLVAIISFIFIGDLAIAYIFQSEKVGGEELSALSKSKSNTQSFQTIVYGENEVEFQLPKGAIEFYNNTYPKINDEKQYLVTKNNWNEYTNIKNLENGFNMIDRMGALFIYKNDANLRVEISTNMFTSNFLRIHVNYIYDK